MRLFLLMFTVGLATTVHAWDDEDYAIFDLVEEINNENWYKFLGVAQVTYFATWIRFLAEINPSVHF